LLSNAIKFTNYGVIEIGCKQRYHFYVEDSGIGIDAKKMLFLKDLGKPMIH
jgi:signal transduction histidine kinase